MIEHKPGEVRLRGASVPCLWGMVVAADTWRDMFPGVPFVLTEVGADGGHGGASLHYAGDAFDYRTSHIERERRRAYRDELKRRLGDEYDVVDHTDAPVHGHVEWQPKRR